MTELERDYKPISPSNTRERSRRIAARKPWAWVLPVVLLSPLVLGAKGCDSAVVGDECPPDFMGENCGAAGGEGTAPGECGGLQGLACASGEYCSFPASATCGAADQTGVCAPRPNACDAVLRPVCGCDGRTYDNACEAARLGVSVAADGACRETPAPTVCGGLNGAACDRGEFCDFPVQARCGAADGTGVCTRVPEACEDVFAPVCGCDGETYSNACEAAAHGISVAGEGACREAPGNEACGGLLGLDCESDEFCNFPPDAACGAADQTGVCTPMPDACDAIFAPVCGCDDKTYSSACAAALVGVSVAAEGSCPVAPGGTCGGLLGTACEEGQYCNFSADAQCGAADQTGVCSPIPRGCTRELNPVCGCDDRTYANPCLAAAAGVSVAQAGECR